MEPGENIFNSRFCNSIDKSKRTILSLIDCIMVWFEIIQIIKIKQSINSYDVNTNSKLNNIQLLKKRKEFKKIYMEQSGL